MEKQRRALPEDEQSAQKGGIKPRKNKPQYFNPENHTKFNLSVY